MITSNWKSREQALGDDRRPLAEVCHVAMVLSFCFQKSRRKICWIFATWGWYHKSISSSTNLTQRQVHNKSLAWDGHERWKCDWHRRWVGRRRRHKTVLDPCKTFSPWGWGVAVVVVITMACSGGGGDRNVCYDILCNAFGKIHSSLILPATSPVLVEVVSLDYQSWVISNQLNK